MANGIPDTWKKVNSYGNSVFSLNVRCQTTGGVYFIFINVLYFSLITQNLEENSSPCFFFISWE